MNEEVSENETTEEGQSTREEIGFPEPVKQKKKNKSTIILVLLALVIAGFFGYSIFFAKESTDTIMKQEEAGKSQPTSTVTPTPTETVTKSRKELKVEVLNGSGKVGVAGTLKTQLEKAQFGNITTGNADNYDYGKTVVYFTSSVEQDDKKEMISILTKAYGTPEEKELESQTVDVKVVIGSQTSVSLTPAKEE